MITTAMQRTIARPAEVAGEGIHTGARTAARMLPAPASSGVTFRRTDLPGAPRLTARLDEVVATSRGVVLGRAARVATVEHLLSAAMGLGIDNLLVELDGEELPCGDGSARIFAEALDGAGTVEQDAPRRPIALAEPVWAADGARMIVAVPSPGLRISYMVTADGTPLEPQFADFDEARDAFAADIAPARTWGLAGEVDALRAGGLARGASLFNVLTLGPNGYVNAPRFPNELARHKILDAIGDLALLGRPLRAHIIAVRAGHGLHISLARAIAAQAS
jgi:UDP-3-O-acyl N-acetylglucosamine deacetylase